MERERADGGARRGLRRRAYDGRVSAPDIETLEEQERRLVLESFSFDTAWQLGTSAVRRAAEVQAPLAIDVTSGGQRVFHAALPGATPENDAWVDRKRRVVERFHASSYLVGSRYRAKGTTFEESSRLDPARYAAHGGAFPLRVANAGLVGVLTVSGLPQVEDHRFVVELLEAFLG